MERERKSLVLLAAAAAATRLYALHASRGFLHPDSLFQLLEQAHRLVFGYGVVPLEYVHGIRSWFQPLLIATVFKAMLWLGATDISQLILANKILMTAVSLALLYVTYQLAKAVYGGKAAQYALLFATFSPILWLWTADPNPHTPAALFTTAALLLFWNATQKSTPKKHLLAGASLGIAFMLRFDSIIFLTPMLAYAAATKKTKHLQWFAAGLAAAVAAQAAIDALTWGAPLYPFIEFVKMNIAGNQPAAFGVQPAYFYLGVLGLHIACLFTLPYALEKREGLVYLALSGLAFLAVYSAVGHKEPRFIIPILPMLFAIAGRGMERAEENLGRISKYAIVVLTVVLGALMANAFGWSPFHETVDSLHFIGGQPDATGVAYDGLWWEGNGYACLHRMIPMVEIANETLDPTLKPVKCGRPNMEIVGFQCANLDAVLAEGGINYVIARENRTKAALTERGFQRVKQDGGFEVYARRR
jgi:GPI mannosyltransferase 3